MDTTTFAWSTVDRREIYRADPWVHLSKETVELPDGRIVEDYHQLRLPDFVAVVAIREDGTILMLRQYKHGPRAVTTTLPGGLVEAEEAALEAAKRELLEETGYGSENWSHLGSFTVHGNLGAGKGHYFFADQVRPLFAPHAGDLEEMSVLALSLREVKEAVRNGEINLLNHVAGLGLAGLI
jgi:ADP-ribose pyrophosphatase